VLSAGLNEEGQEQILRDCVCSLAAAVYLDRGIGAVSEFAAKHVFPPLIKLRETVRCYRDQN
jgi:dsRNA-specific ribonuclease